MMRMVSIAATVAGSPFFHRRVELPGARRLPSDRVPVAACKSGRGQSGFDLSVQLLPHGCGSVPRA